MDSSWGTFTGFQGDDVSLEASKQWQTYADNGWSILDNWDIVEDTGFPFLIEYTVIMNGNGNALGANGTDISVSNALLKSTYETLGWNFPPWNMVDSYPFFGTSNLELQETPDISLNSFVPSIQISNSTGVNNTFTIQKIFDIYLFDLVSGQNIGKLNNLKETNFINEEVTVYATGGVGNSRLVGFNYSKRARIEVKSMVYDLTSIGTQLNSNVIVGMNDEFIYGDRVYVAGNQAFTTYTPVGTSGSEIIYIYKIDIYGNFVQEFQQSSVVEANKFKYTAGSKLIDFYPGDLQDGDEIMMYYRCETDSSTKTISNQINLSSPHVKMVAKGLVKDICTKEDLIIEIIFYNAKLFGDFNIDLIVDGKVATHDLSIEALTNCVNDKLWDTIVTI